MREKKFPETVKWLNVIENDLKISLGDLKGVPAYEGFVASAEYKKWMDTRER